MSQEETDTIIAHGVEHASYANGPGGYRPYMECLCGWGLVEDSWEIVGREFDEHLKIHA